MSKKILLSLILLLAAAQLVVAAPLVQDEETELEALTVANVNGMNAFATLQTDGDPGGLAFSPDGSTLAGGNFVLVQLWDVATGAAGASLRGHSRAVSALAYGPEATQLASAGFDGMVLLWDTASETSVVFSGHVGDARSVAINPDGTLLASGGADGTVRLWDVATGAEQAVLEGHTAPVNAVAFSPSLRSLASASDDGTIRLWTLATGAEQAVLEGHNGPVFDVAFSRGGQLLASGGRDNTVRMWDSGSARSLATLEGHSAPVLSVALSPNGEIIASGGQDNSIRLWSVSSAEELNVLTGHTRPVVTLAFNPASSVLASSSVEGDIRLWGLAAAPPGIVLTLGQTLEAGYDFQQSERCTMETGETLLVAARSAGNSVLAYTSGRGCEGPVWIDGRTADALALSAADLNALAFVDPPQAVLPLNRLPGYNELCAAPSGETILRSAGQPYTLFDPEAPAGFYPAAVMPTTATGIDAVLCRDTDSRVLSTCEFSANLTVNRVVLSEIYTLVAAESGELIARRTFTGNEPPECPEQPEFVAEIPGEPLDPAETWLPWVLGFLVGQERASAGIERTVIRADSVNARSAPSQNSEVIGDLSRDTPVNLIGRDESGQWVAALLPDMTRAWIFLSLLDVADRTAIGALPLVGGPAEAVPIPTP